uniref:Uncharacterized protein n=1 Tax=Opuntia streptacantha TaxID=393608 RepID=A0A7C8YVZ0_OPUST
MVMLHEDIGVDEASQATTNERADPVDPVVMEVTAGDCGSKGPGWVHGPTGEWTSCQDVGPNNEPNSHGGNDAYGALLGVGCCCIHSVDQAKSYDYLQHYCVNCSQS